MWKDLHIGIGALKNSTLLAVVLSVLANPFAIFTMDKMKDKIWSFQSYQMHDMNIMTDLSAVTSTKMCDIWYTYKHTHINMYMWKHEYIQQSYPLLHWWQLKLCGKNVPPSIINIDIFWNPSVHLHFTAPSFIPATIWWIDVVEWNVILYPECMCPGRPANKKHQPE